MLIFEDWFIILFSNLVCFNLFDIWICVILMEFLFICLCCCSLYLCDLSIYCLFYFLVLFVWVMTYNRLICVTKVMFLNLKFKLELELELFDLSNRAWAWKHINETKSNWARIRLVNMLNEHIMSWAGIKLELPNIFC